MVPEIWNMTDKIICHFKLFFDLYPTNNMKNQNFEKNGKKKKTTKKKHTHTHLEIPSFYISVQKIMIICHTVPEMWLMTNVISFFMLG